MDSAAHEQAFPDHGIPRAIPNLVMSDATILAASAQVDQDDAALFEQRLGLALVTIHDGFDAEAVGAAQVYIGSIFVHEFLGLRDASLLVERTYPYGLDEEAV